MCYRLVPSVILFTWLGYNPQSLAQISDARRYCAVPMAVTGHSTIYTWACERGKPRITDEGQLDQRGFDVRIWMPLLN
jgi:hypothetical protein